jgi:hypothetical protein
MGQGGQIHVLDMGQPVRIAELAKELIRLSGFSETEIRIEYTGLRPGEKLYEEPIADSETTLPTPHPKLRVALARPVSNHRFVVEEIWSWLGRPDLPSPDAVREKLQSWIPEYDAARVDTLPRAEIRLYEQRAPGARSQDVREGLTPREDAHRTARGL